MVKLFSMYKKKFRTRVLTNNSSVATNNKDSCPEIKSQDSSAIDQNQAPTSQDFQQAPVTAESNDPHSSNQNPVPMIQDDTTSS